MAIAPSNGKTVLITGINGYIASVLGLALLERGYSLRGTSRRSASSEPLLKGPYAPYGDRVKIYEVPNMTVDGAFDEASKGVHGIFHTASPIDFSITTFEEMVIPAVRGAETVLASALKAGPQLTSVVLTSSTIAVVNPVEGEYTFTEKDFASFALDKALKDKAAGQKTPSSILYGASKTASDQAVWKFRDEHKPSFSISTINPSVVMGPPVILPSSPSKLNETLRPIYDIFSGEADELPPYIGTGAFVDVRNVATMHIWAFENASKSDGERYLGVQGFGPTQAVADVLNHAYKGTKFEEKIIKGTPGEGYVGYDKETGTVPTVGFMPGARRISGQKAVKEMGLQYIPFQQSILDTAKVLEAFL